MKKRTARRRSSYGASSSAFEWLAEATPAPLIGREFAACACAQLFQFKSTAHKLKYSSFCPRTLPMAAVCSWAESGFLARRHIKFTLNFRDILLYSTDRLGDETQMSEASSRQHHSTIAGKEHHSAAYLLSIASGGVSLVCLSVWNPPGQLYKQLDRVISKSVFKWAPRGRIHSAVS